MLASKFIAIDHEAETFTAVVLDEDSKEGRARALKEAEELIKTAREGVGKYHNEEIDMELDGQIVKKSDTIDEQLLHADELREPDEKGHHEQVRAGGDDGF